MRLPFFIARRYFLSRQSQRAVNIISMVSVAGVLVGTAALIIVLSVFNGFENLVIRLYDSFDPDIRIEAAHGKNFRTDDPALRRLQSLDFISQAVPVIEENALVRYNDRQLIVTLKGVGEGFATHSGVDSMTVAGEFRLESGDTDLAVIGSGIAYGLQIGSTGSGVQLDVYAPRREATSLLKPEEAFNRSFILLSGVFAIQQEYDSKYVIVPYRYAESLLEYDSLATQLEVFLKKGADPEAAAEKLAGLLGDGFVVKGRLQQHQSVYRIMKSEKWAVFLILTFILIIATFNIIGTLSMLVLEKRKDVAVLYSMGADERMLRSIFIAEGMLINLVGSSAGMLLGLLVCLGQQRFGWISLGGGGSFVIDAYPVDLKATDFLNVFVTVSTIGLFGAWYPSRKALALGVDLRTMRNDE